VRFVSLTWRGIRDVFEQLMFMATLSLGWWLCVAPLAAGVFLFLLTPLAAPVTVLTSFLIPPATVTLFAMADPRRMVSKPDFHDVLQTFAGSVKQGWSIGAVTVPFLIILFWNVTFFTGQATILAAFVPLWVIIFVFLFILMLYMFSLAGTMESRLRNAFRGGMFVLITRPFTAALLSILIMVVGVLFTLMVLPMLLIGPAMMAAVINRFVLDALQVEVVDPNAPTSERMYEREQGLNPELTVWDRIKRGGRSN